MTRFLRSDKPTITLSTVLCLAVVIWYPVSGTTRGSVVVSSSAKIRLGQWSVTSITVFPFTDYYSERGMNSILLELKTRMPEVNFIDIRTYWQPDPANPDNMTFSGGPNGYMGTPTHSWSELDAMISKVRSTGMDIILWACKDPGAATPAPFNWTIWFDNYAGYIKGVGQWAQSHRIPILVLGAEFETFLDSSLLGNDYVNEWKTIISDLRSVYNGKVVYGVNWWYSPMHWDVIYNQASWLADLDYIQVDTYVSLGMNLYDGANASELAKWWNPTINDLIGNWTNSRFGPNWNYTDMYEQMWKKYGRKIIINIGYRNNNGTNTMPWANPPTEDLHGELIPGYGPDVSEMTDCWEAFFLAWSTCPAIVGADLEHYSQSDSNELNGSFRGKYDAGRGLYTWQIIHNYLSRLSTIS